MYLQKGNIQLYSSVQEKITNREKIAVSFYVFKHKLTSVLVRMYALGPNYFDCLLGELQAEGWLLRPLRPPRPPPTQGLQSHKVSPRAEPHSNDLYTVEGPLC